MRVSGHIKPGAVGAGAKVPVVLVALCVLTLVFSLIVGCESSSDQVRTAMGPRMNEPLKPSPLYTVGAADVVTIDVRGHPELSKTAVVRPDGMISMVLLDDVFVTGQTAMEVDDKLTRMYNEYIVNADVTVSIVGFNSQRIYVWGQVGRQGDQPFPGEMTLADAVARAGGPNQRSEPKKILLTRAGQVHVVNLYDIVIKGNFSENVYLQNGDMIFVPPNNWARVGMALDNIFFPFRNLFAFLFLEKEVSSVL